MSELINKPGDEKCDCCGAMVDSTTTNAWIRPSRICIECFTCWYDGGATNPAEIKRLVEEARAKREAVTR